jgi:hypothetical protein
VHLEWPYQVYVQANTCSKSDNERPLHWWVAMKDLSTMFLEKVRQPMIRES